MRFPKTVSAARGVGRSLWDLADALVQEVPKGSPLSMFEEVEDEIVKNDGEPYAAETLRKYRDAGLAWPRGTRVPQVSFKAHQTLASDPDRFDKLRPGMTARQAAKEAGHKPWDHSTADAPSSPEEKREQFKALASDPDVAEDLSTRAEVTQSLEKATRRQERQTERQQQSQTAGLRTSTELMQAVSMMADLEDKAARIGRIWREHSARWSDEERQTFRDSWAEVAREVGFTTDSLQSEAGWDDALAELVGEES